MEPFIHLFPASYAPPPPTDMHPFWASGPETFDRCEQIPVLVWDNYLYWVYEYLNNRGAFVIIAYGPSRDIVKQWDINEEVRYIWDITLERAKKTITFWGQSNEKVVVKLEKLCITPDQHNLINPPSVVNLIPVSQAPAVPAGLISFMQLPSNEAAQKSGIPVLVWEDYTYRTYEYPDNHLAFAIVAFNKDGEIVKDWNVNGVRYISNITIDNEGKRITFLGQGDQTATFSWNDLKIEDSDLTNAGADKFAQPEIREMPIWAAPAIPAELNINREWVTGPNSHTRNQYCSVLAFHGYTYWAFENKHNENSIGIVAYDSEGNLVKHWQRSGTRYLWSISLDPTRRTVSFWGQGNQAVVMGWDELKVD